MTDPNNLDEIKTETQPTLIKTPKAESANVGNPANEQLRQMAENDDYDGLTFEVIENEKIADKTMVRKGVYLIPNLFTLLSLLAGFYAILISSQGHFMQACVAIFISAILDGMDGRAARMLKAQSPLSLIHI